MVTLLVYYVWLHRECEVIFSFYWRSEIRNCCFSLLFNMAITSYFVIEIFKTPPALYTTSQTILCETYEKLLHIDVAVYAKTFFQSSLAMALNSCSLFVPSLIGQDSLPARIQCTRHVSPVVILPAVMSAYSTLPKPTRPRRHPS